MGGGLGAQEVGWVGIKGCWVKGLGVGRMGSRGRRSKVVEI